MTERGEAGPLVVIVGQTASGKSALALALAREFGGEIIAADSRTVYRGMDIGTAKPTAAERREVRHYGLDLADPDQLFSAYEFKQMAETAITDIASRNKLPIVVGGTGLYIDALIYDFQFRPKADPGLRRSLETLPVAELQAEVRAAGLSLPRNERNPRHLIRLLETGQAAPRNSKLRPNTLLLGLRLGRDELRQRITARVEDMVAAGFIDEVRRVYERYGGGAPGLRAPGYQPFIGYLQGRLSLDQAKQEFIRNDMDLAKRQLTWFKRNPSIHWLQGNSPMDEAAEHISSLLCS